MEHTKVHTTEVKKSGWSWMGFLFGQHYYAGYNRLQKGIVLAVIASLFPLFALIVGVYAGINARKELPIKEIPFNWKNVGITVGVSLTTIFLMQFVIFGGSGSIACNSTQTKKLALEIVKDEMNKRFGKSRADLLTVSLEAVRTKEHNEKLDSYGCAADLKMSNKNTGESKTAPITYTSEWTDDGENFYVNVYGL